MITQIALIGYLQNLNNWKVLRLLDFDSLYMKKYLQIQPVTVRRGTNNFEIKS